MDAAIPVQIAQLLIVLGGQRDSKLSGQDRNDFKGRMEFKSTDCTSLGWDRSRTNMGRVMNLHGKDGIRDGDYHALVIWSRLMLGRQGVKM